MPKHKRKATCHICNHKMRTDNLIRHMKRKDHMQEEEKQDLQANNLSDKRGKISNMGQNNDVQCESDDSNEETLCQSDEDRDKIGKYAWKDNGVKRNHHFLLPRNI